MAKNNMSGPPVIYEPMRMTGVSGIEPRLSRNSALDFTFLRCLSTKLMCPDICQWIYANIATMSSCVYVCPFVIRYAFCVSFYLN